MAGAGKELFLVCLKGMAMGAADIIPGVSGGTIALISGIYERLIQAISSVLDMAIKFLLKGEFKAFWQAIDGNFLCCLFTGILASVFSLATLITWLLSHWPHLVWSLFFGLVLASVWHVGRRVARWSAIVLFSFFAGAILAFWITSMSSTSMASTYLNVFLGGFIAITAMILPGISGSFILLLLGLYAPVLDAVRHLDLVTLVVFASGCLAGLLLTSRLLRWAFRHYHDLTLATLTGFMLGALGKLWPWQQVVSWRTNSHGDRLPLEQVPVSPSEYLVLTGHTPDLAFSLGLMVLGAGFVIALDILGDRSR